MEMFNFDFDDGKPGAISVSSQWLGLPRRRGAADGRHFFRVRLGGYAPGEGQGVRGDAGKVNEEFGSGKVRDLDSPRRPIKPLKTSGFDSSGVKCFE